MKVLILSFVTAVVSSSVCLAYGPVMPMPIATIASEDGTKIEISSDGDVNFMEPGKSPQLLQTLSREALDHFNKDQSGLSIKGQLKASNDSASVCAAPQITTFSARGRDGKMRIIGSVNGCQTLVPSDDSAQSVSMRDFLKSIRGVNRNLEVAKK